VSRTNSGPLTIDAPTVNISRTTLVSGGTSLYQQGADVVITVENTVVLSGNSDTFLDDGCLGCCPISTETKKFWRNLFTSLPTPPVIGSTDSDGGTEVSDMSTTTPGSPVVSSGGQGGCSFGDQLSAKGVWTFLALAVAFLALGLTRRHCHRG
jgi:hypothetical protein